MRGIKPFKLSFITRPFSWGRAHHLGVGVLAYFPLNDAPSLLTDMEMWTEVPEVLGKDAAIDLGIPKSRGELLVSGTAYQPEGEASAVRFVRAQLGEIDKTLNVIGARFWRDGVPTEPIPFESMPLTWANAFGGEGFDENPDGTGAAPVEIDGVEVHPLPHIELPGEMITSPKQRPTPAGLGPIDFIRPSRFSLAGTYDKEWLETRFPGFAEDLDWRMWNAAPADQQQDSPFVGDEEFRMENLHPTKPVIEGRLPGVRARCFMVHAGDDKETLHDVAMKLTTVWLMPEIERGVLVFHGAHPVLEDDGHDVAAIMIAAERLTESPKTIAHYQAAYARRTGEDAVYEALNENDLMPEGMQGLGSLQEKMDFLKPEMLRIKRRYAAAEKKGEAARERLIEMGLDPDIHGPKPLPPYQEPPPLDELGDFVRDKLAELEAKRSVLEEARAESEAAMEKLCRDTGTSLEMLKAETTHVPHGPPTFSAERQRRDIRKLADEAAELQGEPVDELEFYATDEDTYARWVEHEAQFKECYRIGAHLQGRVPAAPENASRERREHVRAAHARGESLADWDLCGVDLSGLDLSGADLTRAFLESVDFSGATLDGAKCDSAVLARANFRGASLVDASFRGANLGEADLTGADCSKAHFDTAIMEEVILERATFADADLSGVSFRGETRVEQASFAGAQLRSTTFVEVSLAGTSWTGADLQESTFFQCDVSDTDFGDANLTDATFFKSNASNARFVGATMIRFRSIESRLPAAQFVRANLREASLRGAELEGGDFGEANLELADLSESNLKDARLFRIVAPRSLWIRADLRGATLMSADLLEALLDKADLRGTALRGANLYGASLALVHSDSETTVEQAIQDNVRFLPLREPPQPPGEAR